MPKLPRKYFPMRHEVIIAGQLVTIDLETVPRNSRDFSSPDRLRFSRQWETSRIIKGGAGGRWGG